MINVTPAPLDIPRLVGEQYLEIVQLRSQVEVLSAWASELALAWAFCELYEWLFATGVRSQLRRGALHIIPSPTAGAPA